MNRKNALYNINSTRILYSHSMYNKIIEYSDQYLKKKNKYEKLKA
jgi:hypothetical protein